MKTQYRIPVTQEHIDNAISCDSRMCVLAQAVRAAIPQAKSVKVANAEIKFEIGDNLYTYRLSRDVALAVIANDEGIPLSPFAFNIKHPVVDPIVTKEKIKVSAHKRSRPRGNSAVAGKASGVLRHMGANIRETLRQKYGPGNRYLGVGV